MSSQTGTNGLLIALSGFALLSVGDAVIKTIGGVWPGTAVAALRYCLGAVGLGLFLWRTEGRAGFIIPMPKIQLLRGFSVAIATLAFFSAIFLMPLAEATAIVFIGPMLTAMISAVWLKEPASRSTWIAAIAAFIGVIIIIRPNFALLGAAALLPLIGALGMAFMMIGNRKVAGSGSPLQMQFLIAAIAAPMLLVAATIGHFSGVKALAVPVPDGSVILRCAFVACTATASHWLVYLGTTRSSAAQIAPMVYVQLLVAMVLGILVFHDWPDGMSLLGSAIIVGAGLYLWQHNQRLTGFNRLFR
jgi:drug/metabolite transporter (DMT)-like permease